MAYKLVNYKAVLGNTYEHTIPLTEDIISQLNNNLNECFHEDECDKGYFINLVNQLHNDFSPTKCKRRKRGVDANTNAVCSLFGTTFEPSRCESLYNLKNRWEMFIYYATRDTANTNKMTVVASCLVHFNDIYRSCEIHEVCISSSFRGKGICSLFLKDVMMNLSTRNETAEVRIFCEKQNFAACKCYPRLHEHVVPIVTETEHTTGYLYRFGAKQQLSTVSSNTVGGRKQKFNS